MIHTLTSDCYLHKCNRNRQQFLTNMEKQRAVILIGLVTACVSIVTYIWIVYA